MNPIPENFSRRDNTIIACVAVLVLILAVVLWLTAGKAKEMQIRNNQSAAVYRLLYAMNAVDDDIRELRFNSSERESLLKRTDEHRAEVDKILEILTSGGVLQSDSGKKIEVQALTLRGTSVANLQRQWTGAISVFGDYRAQPHRDGALALASEQMKSYFPALRQSLGQINEDLRRDAGDDAAFVRSTLRTALIFSLLYAAFVVWLLKKRMSTAGDSVREARDETSEIMATVKEGLFLLDEDLTIGGQYSAELEKMIGQRDLGGKNLVLVLDQIVPPEDIATTRAFVRQLFNKKVKAKLVNDLNPLREIRVDVTDLNGHRVERWLDFQFFRVLKNNEISRVLVSVSDVSSQVELRRRLEEEREQNDQQIEMLSVILKTDPDMMAAFIRSVHRCMDHINGVLKSKDNNSSAELKIKLREIYRETHSMKGEASALKLKAFVTIAAGFEERIKQLQGMSNITGNDFLSLTVLLDELHNVFEAIEQLAQRIGYTQGSDKIAEEKGDFMRRYFEEYGADIAARHKKRLAVDVQGLDDPALPEPVKTVFKEICIQFLRNAVVHGIETPEERRRAGKPEEGKVTISFAQAPDGTGELVVEDDGNGLNFERIRHKAVEKGLCSALDAPAMTRNDLLAIIFSPGFSTSEQTDEDSGRGVGLDLIKSRIRSLNGKLKVASVPGQYTRFSVVLPPG